jgi:hypothetical protein
MNKRPKILAFAGSLRQHSYNKRVLKAAIQGAEKAGATVTFVDLRDYPMPVYSPDDHERDGFNEKAFEFQGLLNGLHAKMIPIKKVMFSPEKLRRSSLLHLALWEGFVRCCICAV